MVSTLRKKKFLFILLLTAGFLAVISIGLHFLINARSMQMAGNIVTHAETDLKKIALTFDDGPSEYTSEILAMLDDLNVKCTFFLTGEAIENNMDAAKQIVAAGHQIGNHSYSHERMIFRSVQWIADEIDRTNELIRETGYEGTIYFRPPYCKKLLLLPIALAQRDMTTATWSVEITNSDNYEEIADAIMRQAKPGDIILMHIMYDSGKQERKAIPVIIQSLCEQGYDFVTLDQLFVES